MDSIIRRIGFNTIDIIKKDSIFKNLKELEKMSLDIEKLEKIKENRLEKLLSDAVNDTEFYSRFNGYKSIKDFPIIKKSDVKDNFDKFLSNKFQKNDLLKLTTSGSYGMPFTFLVTKNKKARLQSQVAFFNKFINYKIGDRHAYIRCITTKSKLKLFAQNEVLMNPVNIDEIWLKNSTEKLKNDKRIKFIVGYVSSVVAISNYIKSEKYNIEDFNHIKGITVSAEALTEIQRNIIKSVFNCPVVSRYATEELGILAHECEYEKNHHLNDYDFYIEILKLNCDEEAEEGEIGRIVVTDLFSNALPLIRYEIGDLVTVGSECECGRKGRVLKNIEGRLVETILDSNGNRVSPFALNGALRDILNIRQFQFIQKTKKDYVLKIVKQEGFDSEEIILQRYRNILGNSSNIKIEYVDDIKPLKSGKRPYIINEHSSVRR